LVVKFIQLVTKMDLNCSNFFLIPLKLSYTRPSKSDFLGRIKLTAITEVID